MKRVEEKEKFDWYAVKMTFVILIVFVLQSIFPDYFEPFVLISSKVFRQPWSLITYIFLHGSANHVFSNMFSLVLFGSILEKIVGYKNFLLIFFSAGIFSGVASVFFYPSVIGASGAIFGVMGMLAIIRPKMVVLAFGIPIPMIVAVAIWTALDLGGIFYPNSVAHIGHLAGLFAGIVAGMLLRSKYKLPKQKKRDKIKLSEDYFRKWEEKYMKMRIIKI